MELAEVELTTRALEGLIAAGPVACLLAVAMWWLLGRLGKEEKKVEDKDVEIKRLTTELQVANGKISDAKDLCQIEILKVQKSGHEEKIALYERIMKVLETVGGGNERKAA